MCAILLMIMCVVSGVKSLPLGDFGQKCGTVASYNPLHLSPWTVYLEYLHGDRLTRARCGGTLIDSRHVVTAAHCMKHPHFDTIKVRLGEHNLEHGVDCIDGVCSNRIVTIKVKTITVHPGYDGKEDDIAVLTLEEDAPYTDFIRPACLPSGQLRDDIKFIATGWGILPPTGEFSHVKKSLTLPFFKLDACQKVFGDRKLPKNVICAGGQSGIDTCSGDSGGPLVWMKKERGELWGVISSGSPYCGLEGIPGIYTRVVDYLQWIDDVIKGNTNK